MMLPGKHVISERDDAPFVGYWIWSEREATNSVVRDLRAAYDAAISSAHSFTEHVGALKSGGDLTPKGVREAAARSATDAVARIVRNKVQATAKLRTDIEARRAKMVPVAIDRNDIVGEMQRRELRDKLNAMPEKRRVQLIEAGDDAVLDAIFGAPRQAVDLPDAVRQAVLDKRMKARFGEEAALLDELSEVMSAVERAHDGALDEVRHELGMLPHEFQAFLEPIATPILNEHARKSAEPARRPAAKPASMSLEDFATSIRDMPFDERSRLLDLAINVQGQALEAR